MKGNYAINQIHRFFLRAIRKRRNIWASGRYAATGKSIYQGDCTLVQSVDSIAINIYFNKIPSFLFATVLFYDTVRPRDGDLARDWREAHCFFSAGICIAVSVKILRRNRL